jgi:hypothetical protein
MLLDLEKAERPAYAQVARRDSGADSPPECYRKRHPAVWDYSGATGEIRPMTLVFARDHTAFLSLI